MFLLIIYSITLLILSFYKINYYDFDTSDTYEKNFYLMTLISFCNIFLKRNIFIYNNCCFH